MYANRMNSLRDKIRCSIYRWEVGKKKESSTFGDPFC